MRKIIKIGLKWLKTQNINVNEIMQNKEKEVLIVLLQERCDVYSGLLEKLVTNIMDVAQYENLNTQIRMKLSDLLYEISPQIKQIQDNIAKTDNLFNNSK